MRIRPSLALLGLGLVLACVGEGSDAGRPRKAGSRSNHVMPAVAGLQAGPFLRVLGIAQDGGFPHAACEHALCVRARQDPSLASGVASLGLVLPKGDGTHAVLLVDATPDVRAQIDLLRDVRRPSAGRVDRAPLAGLLLTHAHIGHYLGLAFFGFEAVNTHELPVYATPRMATFLRTNGPWSQLVTKRNIALHEQAPGSRFKLGVGGAQVEIGVLAVPHRDEYSDTVGFVFAGPHRRVLYVPDTDGWDRWSPSLAAVLARERIDVALLDASFYSLDELPGRDLTQVRHPLVVATMDRLAPFVAAGGQVFFCHLNHSNPALDPASEARRAIEARGFAVAAVGQEIGL